MKLERFDFDSFMQNPGTGWYGAMCHPDVALDLREQSGSGAWRVPQEYAGAANANGFNSGIWSGELGAFEGFRFVENSRAPYFVQAGSSSQNVYGTLFFGREAILKIWATVEGNAEDPQIVESPITDRLRRFRPIGWYWFRAYGIFAVRTASTATETSSSVHRWHNYPRKTRPSMNSRLGGGVGIPLPLRHCRKETDG